MKHNHTRRGYTQKTQNVVICPPCGEDNETMTSFSQVKDRSGFTLTQDAGKYLALNSNYNNCQGKP